MRTLHALMEGTVVDTDDPLQMGRVKIWVPAIDGDNYEIDHLPWATHLTPFGGNTREYPAGPGAAKTGFMSYGMFMPPKIRALVVCGFLYGDPNKRVYIGSYWRDQGNRSMPRGRNRKDIGPSPVNDQLDPIEPAQSHMSTQFQGNLTASEAQTRGAYERSIGADDPKDGTEGYPQDLLDPTGDHGKKNLDPQTYAISTPGRHSLIFQDNPVNGRARLVTASGHQIILDDANERIYISTAKGRTWVELDQDGRVHVYAADSISLATGGDFNVTAGGDLNMSAGGDVNIGAGGATMLAACDGMHISGATMNLEAGGKFDILAAANLTVTASKIDLNGPSAGSAECPAAPSIVPSYEPWTRAGSAGPRNANWKA